jgi:hypothetical protein
MKPLVINRHWPAYSEEVTREFIGEMGAITAEEALRRAASTLETRRSNRADAEARQAAARLEEKKAA